MSENRNRMTDRAFAYLIYLLRLGLGISTEAHEVVAPDVWRSVYRQAKKHAVVGIAWDGVEQLQAQASVALQSLPADIMGKWYADAQAIASANVRLTKQARDVQTLLQQGGFASHLLKGATLAAYYPQPTHRQAADIDFWVLPKQAGQSLAEHRRALIAFLQKQDITIDAVVYHHIETTILGTDVELHVTPSWLCNPLHNYCLQYLFAQAGHITPDQQELYCLLHAFRHIYHDGLALRHVLDYLQVCRHNRAADIPAPEALYRQLGLARFARAMNEVSNYLFAQTDSQRLSGAAGHLLSALPERKVTGRVQWDYPSETLCVLPWRTIHHVWRKANHYL